MVACVTRRRETRESRSGLCLDENEANFFFRQLIWAVQFCHKNHVAHRWAQAHKGAGRPLGRSGSCARYSRAAKALCLCVSLTGLSATLSRACGCAGRAVLPYRSLILLAASTKQ